jgi:hypothetical protein
MSYLHNKTVYVVGAGASCEFELPSGLQLRDKIVEALDLRFGELHKQISGDSTIYKALQRWAEVVTTSPRYVAEFVAVSWKIRDGMLTARSIDDYIDSHSDDKDIELCGKLAIVRSILDAEQKSSLYLDPNANTFKKLNFAELQKTWLNSFLQTITEHCTAKDLPARLNLIALVIFNYDRCIEHYLYHALQNYYPSISPAEVAALLTKMEIYHPYGSVGPLSWVDPVKGINFGGEPDSNKLLDLASGIKTFSESVDPPSRDSVLIRDLVRGSPRLIFLGFAFHQMNIDLLMPTTPPPQKRHERKRIFGTVLDVSKFNVDHLRTDLSFRAQAAERNIHLSDVKCKQLFDDYQRGLALL